jgi:hypothetical protein
LYVIEPARATLSNSSEIHRCANSIEIAPGVEKERGTTVPFAPICVLPWSEFTHRSSVPELNPYARFLDGRPVAEILVSTPGALEALTEAIGSERLAFSPAPGKWTPAEILCHMADCEVAFGFRLRQTLAEDHHVLQPFDQEKWAATYPSVTAQQALAAFTAMREWNLILIRNAPQGAAKKPVTHPERGIMTFATITETMAGHDLNHIAQLEKLAGS